MEKFDLPVLPQEKVGRAFTWLFVVGVFLFLGNTLLPYTNNFLSLLEVAMSSMMNIVITGIGLVFLLYVTMVFFPLVTQGVNAFAERATWAMINADPVAHLRVWYKEVEADKQEFANQLEAIGGAIATVERSKASMETEADKSQKKYEAAKRAGKNASVFANAAGKYGESAKRYGDMLGPLGILQTELSKLYKIYDREADNLSIDIDIQSKEWQVAQQASTALDSAFTFLTKKSDKQIFAEKASQVIGNRYALQFGRLRTLKQMSQDLIAKFDLQSGVYDQEAYLRWQQQSAVVIDSSATVLEPSSIHTKAQLPHL